MRAGGGLGAALHAPRGPDGGCRKPHQIVFDAAGRHLLVACLGSDYVLQLTVHGTTAEYADPPTAAVAGGPRHLALSPDERHAYVLSERASLLTSFAYDPVHGTLSDPEVTDAVQREKGASAHVAVHPSGRFAYVSNRADNSLGVYAIDAQGRPHALAFEHDGIDTPRDFAIDPAGEYLILANQHGAQDLRVYRIDARDGRLSQVASVPVGGEPGCVALTVLP